MICGYIYKIVNTVNDKVYIGLTTKTVEERFRDHLNACTERAKKKIHLYAAMQLYGKDKFSAIQIDTAETIEELSNKERYWIQYYDAIKNGYNMAPGGEHIVFGDDAIEVKEKHLRKMRSQEVRDKISKTLSDYRNTYGFSDEHKKKIRESSQKRKEERAKQGLKFYDDCSHCATRCQAVYCILDTGERFDFQSIKEAGIWWFTNYKPFGENYSVPTFQRKIEASIGGKEIIYQAGHNSQKKGQKNVIYKITNIKWYRPKEGDVNE